MRHLFICTNQRASGKPACGLRGGLQIASAVQVELLRRGVTAATAMVTPCDCLGPCFDGPNAVVYPEGVWYERLSADDASALADHLVDGTIDRDRERLRTPPDE